MSGTLVCNWSIKLALKTPGEDPHSPDDVVEADKVSWFPRAAIIHESGSGLEPNVESVMGQESVIPTHAFTSGYNCMGSNRGREERESRREKRGKGRVRKKGRWEGEEEEEVGEGAEERVGERVGGRKKVEETERWSGRESKGVEERERWSGRESRGVEERIGESRGEGGREKRQRDGVEESR